MVRYSNPFERSDNRRKNESKSWVLVVIGVAVIVILVFALFIPREGDPPSLIPASEIPVSEISLQGVNLHKALTFRRDQFTPAKADGFFIPMPKERTATQCDNLTSVSKEGQGDADYISQFSQYATNMLEFSKELTHRPEWGTRSTGVQVAITSSSSEMNEVEQCFAREHRLFFATSKSEKTKDMCTSAMKELSRVYAGGWATDEIDLVIIREMDNFVALALFALRYVRNDAIYILKEEKTDQRKSIEFDRYFTKIDPPRNQAARWSAYFPRKNIPAMVKEFGWYAHLSKSESLSTNQKGEKENLDGNGTESAPSHQVVLIPVQHFQQSGTSGEEIAGGVLPIIKPRKMSLPTSDNIIVQPIPTQPIGSAPPPDPSMPSMPFAYVAVPHSVSRGSQVGEQPDVLPTAPGSTTEMPLEVPPLTTAPISDAAPLLPPGPAQTVPGTPAGIPTAQTVQQPVTPHVQQTLDSVTANVTEDDSPVAEIPNVEPEPPKAVVPEPPKAAVPEAPVVPEPPTAVAPEASVVPEPPQAAVPEPLQAAVPEPLQAAVPEPPTAAVPELPKAAVPEAAKVVPEAAKVVPEAAKVVPEAVTPETAKADDDTKDSRSGNPLPAEESEDAADEVPVI